MLSKIAPLHCHQGTQAESFLVTCSTDPKEPAVRTVRKQTAAHGYESSYSITLLLIDGFYTRRNFSSRSTGRSQALLLGEGSAPHTQHGREMCHTLLQSAEFDFKEMEGKASIT